MITKRFRSLGWVGCVSIAALGCYLVSQRVASERAAVENLDRRIAMARIDIRKLQTELGTRSRMPVLEQWNSDVLALSAPSAGQYLHGEVQLARFESTKSVPAEVQTVSAPAPQPRAAEPVLVASSEEPSQPLLRHANFIKPADGSFEATPRKVALLDDAVLGDLQQVAKREKHGSNGQR